MPDHTYSRDFGVQEIFWSFSLVLEGKIIADNKRDTQIIKIRVFRKRFSKQFCFITCKRHHFQAVEQSRYSRFSFVENTNSNFPKVLRTNLVGSDGLICFIHASLQVWQLQEPFCNNY